MAQYTARNAKTVSGSNMRYPDGNGPNFSDFEAVMGPHKQPGWVKRSDGHPGYRKQNLNSDTTGEEIDFALCHHH